MRVWDAFPIKTKNKKQDARVGRFPTKTPKQNTKTKNKNKIQDARVGRFPTKKQKNKTKILIEYVNNFSDRYLVF